jgi:hypothetical protein
LDVVLGGVSGLARLAGRLIGGLLGQRYRERIGQGAARGMGEGKTGVEADARLQLGCDGIEVRPIFHASVCSIGFDSLGTVQLGGQEEPNVCQNVVGVGRDGSGKLAPSLNQASEAMKTHWSRITGATTIAALSFFMTLGLLAQIAARPNAGGGMKAANYYSAQNPTLPPLPYNPLFGSSAAIK